MKFGIELPLGLTKAVATIGRKIDGTKGLPLNERISQRWKDDGFSVLHLSLGLRVSSCSGVGQTARLGRILLDCLPIGIHSYDGGSLSSLEPRVRTLLLAKSTEVPTAWACFQESEKGPTKALLSHLIENLRRTGLDKKAGTITFWRPNWSDSQSTISLPLSNNGLVWMKEHGATFAVLTNDCMETRLHRCQDHIPGPRYFRITGLQASLVKYSSPRCPPSASTSPRLVFRPGCYYILQSGTGYFRQRPSGEFAFHHLPPLYSACFKWLGYRVSNAKSNLLSTLLDVEFVHQVDEELEIGSESIVIQ
ncbi:hypothetical protein ABW21_db0203218 [Orbilia brochopaga]|nr:hypothetical protein ABW21_db0203218 [Drechslerella brochopaga]